MTDSNASTWGMPTPGQAASTSEPLHHIEQASFEGRNLLGGSPTRPPTANPAPFVPGTAAEQLAYQRGQQDAVRKLTAPRMTGWRITCGICWAIWTLLLTIGAFASLGQGNVGSFLLAGVLAGLAAWYDYRIWALKARRLTLFIIF
jgi:hypothetical protein